jgi:hypothetical protein
MKKVDKLRAISAPSGIVANYEAHHTTTQSVANETSIPIRQQFDMSLLPVEPKSNVQPANEFEDEPILHVAQIHPSNNNIQSYLGESLVDLEDFNPATSIIDRDELISVGNFMDNYDDNYVDDFTGATAVDVGPDSMVNDTNFEFQANPAISDEVSELNPILGQELPNHFNSISDYIDASGVQALFTEAQEELQAAATESMWTDPIRDIDWSDLH